MADLQYDGEMSQTQLDYFYRRQIAGVSRSMENLHWLADEDWYGRATITLDLVRPEQQCSTF